MQYLAQLGAEPVVRRNDEVGPGGRARLRRGAALARARACPRRPGSASRWCARAAGRVPVLGVCLGHQAIAVAYGAVVSRAPELLHGKTSLVEHDGAGVLAGLPDPFTATRYHSLAVEPATVPDELEVTGRTASGVVMALRHREVAVEGVQFHPESVLTEGGHRLLANWLAVCGDPDAVRRSAGLTPVVRRAS